VRLGRRGYNQSALLARAFAEQLNLTLSTEVLARIRNTPSQVGLDRDARWDNVWGAFRSDSGSLLGARVLLIDDVLTTGATLEACAAALLEASASQVHALTLTRAPDAPQ
jgi:predicted amidophosphoribosyltransferase